MQSQVHQDLRSDPVIPQVGFESQLEIGLDRVAAFVLKSVRFQFIEQTDAAAFLIQLKQHAAAFGFNNLHGAMQLIPAIAPQRPECVRCQAA